MIKLDNHFGNHRSGYWLNTRKQRSRGLKTYLVESSRGRREQTIE